VSAPRLARLAAADFFERSRSVGFLVMLVSGVWAANVFLPPNGAHYATLQVANHRALYSSGYTGLLVALLTTLFFGLAGFYLVKDAVDRDRRTRVGDVLAATRLGSPTYLLAKAFSNFLVLASLTAVLAVSAGVLQMVRGEDMILRPLELLAPFVWITLPYMAVVAAIAVLFECVPFLRGGFGNVVWFALWIAGIAIGSQAGERSGVTYRDAAGMGLVVPQIVAATKTAFPADTVKSHDVSIGVNVREGEWRLTTFAWRGVSWTTRLIAARAGWFAIAALLVLLAALPFDRFDAARRFAGPWRRTRAPAADPAPVIRGDGGTAAGEAVIVGAPAAMLLDARPATRGSGFAGLVLAEIRLALRGLPRIWGLVALGLAIAALLAPLTGVKMVVAPIAWVWPLLVWSQLGTRDARTGTAGLFDSSPRPLARQIPAAWLAGVAVAAVTGGTIGARLMIAGDAAGALACAAGVLAVPAFALACGSLSGTSRLFEALYLVIWYLGVANHVPAVDFSGASVPDGAFRTAMTFAIALVASLVVAGWARSRRLAR